MRENTAKSCIFFSFLWPAYELSYLKSTCSVAGAQIFNRPCVCYCHNLLPLIKMSNQNITYRGTQTTGLGVMIGTCSPDSLYEGNGRHLANADRSFIRYTNDDSSNNTNQRHQNRKRTKKDNKLALHCYFKRNSTRNAYWKIVRETWEECARFQITSKRLTDQVRTIIKKGCFFDLEISKIHQKINSE